MIVRNLAESHGGTAFTAFTADSGGAAVRFTVGAKRLLPGEDFRRGQLPGSKASDDTLSTHGHLG